MPRTCTICAHSERSAIDRALVTGEALASIAARSRVSEDALARHQVNHLPKLLAQSRETRDNAGEFATALASSADQCAAAEQAHALDVMTELRRCFERVNLLFDACDRWLRDPDDPSRYDVGPRAEDVLITYLAPSPTDGKLRPKKAPLSHLLARLEGSGLVAEHVETKHADPRELILKTAGQLKGQTELLAKLLGELDERPVVNVTLSAEWLTLRGGLLAALQPYPDARLAVAARLGALEATNGHRD